MESRSFARLWMVEASTCISTLHHVEVIACLSQLRAGEIRGLHRTSVDLRRRLITAKIRTVPMTKRLAADRSRGGPLVFSKADDLSPTKSTGEPRICHKRGPRQHLL